MLERIKLIIWDLDDTFWNETLSENSVTLNKTYIDFVKKLTDKGIINSIYSKNDFNKTKEFFENNNLKSVWDLFVFQSINWEPKGNRIKMLIKNMALREENVLFIDDNITNLKEASFYCPKIKTLNPKELINLIPELSLIEKDDKNHTRLQQYKILEAKQKDKTSYSNNEDFLYSSNIKVEIKNNCLDEIDRISELIKRTNQLNYTKLRITKEELEALIKNPNFEARFIKISDNY